MNSKKNIEFIVSIEEANLLFKALGNLPFNEVYELIGKLNNQANNQLASNEAKRNSLIDNSGFNLEDLLK